MAANNQLVKELNKSAIRKALRNLQTSTKPQLARESGLSVVTVNALLQELEDAGEVYEDGMAPSGGGRPSVQYSYNHTFRYAAVVYGFQQQDQNCVRVAVVDLAGDSVWVQKKFLREITVESFCPALDQAFRRYPKISLLAFGLPGEEVDGEIILNDYRNLIGKKFMAYYRERYRVPVIFENDINAMAYGHYHRMGKRDQNVVGIYFPRLYPPGAGLILDGNIYYGNHHFAGEMMCLPLSYRWEELDYDNQDQLFLQMRQVLSIFCSTVAPARIVLFGDFFSEKLLERLGCFLRDQFRQYLTVELESSGDMIKDYEYGMVKLALEYLDAAREG